MSAALPAPDVSVPITPYVLLHTCPRGAAPGSCFAGFWVTAWHAKLPVYQVDRASAAEPVVRTLAAEVDDDGQVAAAWLRGCRVFVTTELRHLAQAAVLGTPTVYVADGLGSSDAEATALAAFAPTRLRVVRSATPFRRDLALDDLHDAIEALAPDTLQRGLSESAKCRERLACHLAGRIADLGHGGSKIAPHAVGVDFFKCAAWDHIGDVRDLSVFADGSFDTVYSSHCLEDLWHPEQALREWLRVLRPGGRLVLYLPLRDHYPNVGTPGANPGHKDDYVPEDVVAMLERIGGVEVLVAARREAEDSFEVVAARTVPVAPGTRSLPAPEVSVLLVAERSHAGADVVADLIATATVAHAQLAGIAHEVLILLREHLQGDDRAAVFDLAARWPECRIVEDLLPHAWPARVRRLTAQATGRYVLALQPGALPLSGALPALLARARRDGADLVRPALRDLDGRAVGHDDEPGVCVLVRRERLAGEVAAATPYLTAMWWNGLADDLRALGDRVCDVEDAVVHTPGATARHPGACGPVRSTFDRALRARGVAGTALLRAPEMRENVLLCVLKTLGDCVLALPVVDELAARHPELRLTVLCEAPYAWVFASHPAVRTVLTVPVCDVQPYTMQEDACLHAVLAEREFDRVVILSDRLDNATYHHSGTDLRSFYAWQAGLPAAAARRPGLHLASAARARAQRALHDRGVLAPYGVLHTQPGWQEKRPPRALFVAVAQHLLAQGITPVVVGGAGERLDVHGVVELAGSLSQEESAAVIAGAHVFCGGDSGPMHIASAFDVPTLALYAGSGIRVAPPLATRAMAVQAPGSCALACGVSPCREATPCADSLRAEHALPRLAELLAASPAATPPVREWLGSRPAVYRHGPEGPVLQRLAPAADPCQHAVPGRSAAFAASDALALLLPARAAHAPREAACVETMPAPSVAEVAAMVVPPRPAASTDDPQLRALHRDLGRVLDTLAPVDALVVLRALVHRALRRGRPTQTLQFVGVLLARAGDLASGRAGRARPAYRPWAEQYLQAFLGPLASARGFLPLLESCVAAFTAAMGAPPAPDLVAELVAASGGNEGDGGGWPHLSAALAAAQLDDDRRALAFAALGAHDRAEDIVSRMLATCAERRRSGLLLRRALLRVRLQRMAEAMADVEMLQAMLPREGAADLVEVVGRLHEWLLRQRRGVLEPQASRAVAPAAVAAGEWALPC